MISALFSRLIVLTFGTLYPAYASYKAVRTKCVKEYVKWMMYWIVFAFFTFIETFTDLLLSWFPFYYEVKIVIVFWLLSPATKGSSTLYRNFVHPMLTRREQEIDDYINQAKERGYSTVLQLGSKGVNYATNVIMQTAIKTIQLASTNSGLPPTRPLTSSQSATTISSYGRLARDATDETDLLSTGDRMGTVRSSSLHNFATSMEFSEEDEAPVYYATNVDNVELLEEDEDMVALSELVGAQSDVGAARTRKGRPRKVNSTGTITEVKRSTGTRTASKNVGTSTSAVRGRRKLREPTPDMDIDIE